jgi:hypothetical protein
LLRRICASQRGLEIHIKREGGEQELWPANALKLRDKGPRLVGAERCRWLGAIAEGQAIVSCVAP